VRGTYSLSILLQELALAREHGLRSLILPASVLRENPVDRLARLIRELFWDGLRRTVDARGTWAMPLYTRPCAS
jgi:alpha,alpha-trehalase